MRGVAIAAAASADARARQAPEAATLPVMRFPQAMSSLPMLQAAARMGVGPEGFWRLSLKEWRMLTAGPVQAAPLGRGELERMREMWPDD